MSDTTKHKQRRLDDQAIAVKFLERSTESILNEIIFRAVKGEPSPWPIDDSFNAEGSFEARYIDGDKQILLWAILDYAQNGEPVPKWATEALSDRIFRTAKGEFATWDGAFGKIYAKKRRQNSIRTLARMVDVWKCVWKHVTESKEKRDKRLFKRVGKELGVGSSTTVQNLFSEANCYFELLHREEAKRASLTSNRRKDKFDRQYSS
jgi:hypothetical protein